MIEEVNERDHTGVSLVEFKDTCGHLVVDFIELLLSVKLLRTEEVRE